MANGDDGYVNTGGGGSVWWELGISEGQLYETEIVDLSRGDHRKRRNGHSAYRLNGHDKYTKPDSGSQEECYVVTITDARTIKRIEIVDNKLRIFVPVSDQALDDPGGDPPAKGDKVPQIRLRWGVQGAVVPQFPLGELEALLKKAKAQAGN